ncbi:uncharacterized protein LOC110007798 [Amborella trichopoda]|uniref:uncharacterized protein LOC110007798 n=1 Tax=Amborella trichopoda TaxID=13333 RepID=UPI0009C06CC9|nr:uncharacterized protein LOC110007798 [Amborella trichopoda]|eukprot:XP_020526716.1 uncharacterized protein LOC110007798 [Amborella trichopoda]
MANSRSDWFEQRGTLVTLQNQEGTNCREEPNANSNGKNQEVIDLDAKSDGKNQEMDPNNALDDFNSKSDGKNQKVIDLKAKSDGQNQGFEQKKVPDDLQITERRSYAQALGKLSNVDGLPNPIHDEKIIRVKIPQRAYEEQLMKHKFALIGRLNLRNLTIENLKKYVRENWKLIGRVTLIVLGKGFILFRFNSEADMTTIWRRGPYRIDGQLLRFQRWQPDFNVNQNTSHALQWIRFPDLPQEHWHDEILLHLQRQLVRQCN